MTDRASLPGAPLRPILLAAGGSTRFAGGHKLLERLAGERVVARAARPLLAPDLGRPTAILGARADEVAACLREAFGDAIELRVNERFEDGMASSLAIAARAVTHGEGMLIALADMPLLAAGHHRAVAAALDDSVASAVARGAVRGVPGHPVALGPAWPPRLEELRGDRGAGPLLRGHEAALVELPEPSQLDVDTREALERARALVEPPGG